MDNKILLDNELEHRNTFRTVSMGNMELFIVGLSTFYTLSYIYNKIMNNVEYPLWEVIYLLSLIGIPALYILYIKYRTTRFDKGEEIAPTPKIAWVLRYILPVFGGYMLVLRVLHCIFFMPDMVEESSIWAEFIGFSILELVWGILCWKYFRVLNKQYEWINSSELSS